MKISVVIPYRDSAPWLDRCCKSLKSQWGDFEFIFVDDNSIDGGAEIVEKYVGSDDRFISLNNEHKAGVSGARNTGIEHARGEWVTFLDADDEFLPHAHKHFAKAIEADSEAEIHQFNHMRYYTEINKLVLKYANDGGKYSINPLPQMWFGVWNKLYKSAFLKTIRFDEDLQYGEDGLFNLEYLSELMKHSKCYIHHADRTMVVVKHRFDNKQSLTKRKKLRDIFKQVRAYEDLLSRTKNPLMRIVVCKAISDIWCSPSLLELMWREAEQTQ